MDNNKSNVRIDKWLWAARFFKTRSIAKTAVESGKVRCDGQRIKPSRVVSIGNELVIKQGHQEKTVIVLAIDDRRKGAPEAQKLYSETSESIVAREEQQAMHKLAAAANPTPDRRPNKKQRRKIIRFNQQNNNED